MSEQSNEWHDGVVDVADELVQEYSAEGAIDRLQRRRESTRSDELEARCLEAIAFIRREVLDDE
jgi:hypothetical protein